MAYSCSFGIPLRELFTHVHVLLLRMLMMMIMIHLMGRAKSVLLDWLLFNDGAKTGLHSHDSCNVWFGLRGERHVRLRARQFQLFTEFSSPVRRQRAPTRLVNLLCCGQLSGSRAQKLVDILVALVWTLTYREHGEVLQVVTFITRLLVFIQTFLIPTCSNNFLILLNVGLFINPIACS